MRKVMLIVLSVVLLLTACVATEYNIPENEADQSKETEVQKEEGKYFCISGPSDFDYFTDHKLGFIKACEELNVEYEYLSPAKNDVDVMKEYMEYAIVAGAKGIVLFGGGDELTESVNKAWEQGIPTVTIDGDLEDSKRISFVGTNNTEAGQTSARLAIRELAVDRKLSHANVMLLTDSTVPLHRERSKAVKDIFAKYLGVRIIMAETGSSTNQAYANVMEILKERKDIDMIICTDYYGGPGAAAAVEELNLNNDIKIVAMDRNSYVLEEIKDGPIVASLMQQTALMPYYAVRLLYNFNHPEFSTAVFNTESDITGVPPYIDTGVYIINKDNCDYFIRN